MPRTRAEVAIPDKSVPNAMIASAARIGRGFKDYLRIARGTEWHEEAWNMYDIVGEYRYACDWVGGMLSKAILYATHASGGKVSKLTSGPAFEALDVLFGDDDGRAEMLRLIGIHLSVTGDCWLVGYTTREHGYEEDVWEVVASTRLRQPIKDGKYTINDEVLDIDPADVLVIRLWRPHPRHSDRAVSPSKAALPILAELVKLTQHVAAQVDSRLISAGILLMPTEMNFKTPPKRVDSDGKMVTRTANSAEDLFAIIVETATAAIENRADPSSLVPIVVTAPAEAIAAVKHLKFWSELDATAIDLRNEAIRRLALSMDMPPEVLQGVAEANHWSAWAVDESAIKAHTEPLLKIVTSSLAKEYLRPLVMDETGDAADIRNYSIKADTTDLRVRPNRAKEALELYDRQELSGASLRRETGFTEDDKMDTEELKHIFTLLAAKGSPTPELMDAALRVIGVDLPEQPAGVEAQPDAKPGRPAPSLKELPVRDIPDRERSERRKQARDRGDVPSAAPPSVRAATLIAASEQAVCRALERAGNRMKNKVQANVAAPASMLYMSIPTKVGDYDFLLDDAWTNVAAIANRHDVPVQWLKSTLDTYCRTIMANQTLHDYDSFTEHMTRNLQIFDMQYPMEVTA